MVDGGEKKEYKPPVMPTPVFGEQFLFRDGAVHKPCSECGGWSRRTQWLNNGDYTYRCLRCGCMEGCPTDWALCHVKGIVSRDNVFNDCWLCQFYVQMRVTYDPQGSNPCPKFIRLLKFDEVHNSPWFKEKGFKIIEV